MKRWSIAAIPLAVFFIVIVFALPVKALTESGNVNVSGLVPLRPPTVPALIKQPLNGSVFKLSTLVVKGSCGANLLVRVFNNGELAGSVTCAGDGTFIVNITLDEGKNTLQALNYDILNQPGPVSPKVTVYFELEVSNSLDSDGSGRPPEGAERLFEGTVVEPLAKALGIEKSASAQTNEVLNALLNFAMVLTVITLAVQTTKRTS